MKLDNILFNNENNNIKYNKIIIENFNNKIISIIHSKDDVPNKFDIKYTPSLWKEFVNLYYNKMITFHTILSYKTQDILINVLEKNQFIFISNLNEIENCIKNILREYIIYNKYIDKVDDVIYEIV